jgi:hypothetical protein
MLQVKDYQEIAIFVMPVLPQDAKKTIMFHELLTHNINKNKLLHDR